MATRGVESYITNGVNRDTPNASSEHIVLLAPEQFLGEEYQNLDYEDTSSDIPALPIDLIFSEGNIIFQEFGARMQQVDILSRAVDHTEGMQIQEVYKEERDQAISRMREGLIQQNPENGWDQIDFSIELVNEWRNLFKGYVQAVQENLSEVHKERLVAV